MFGFNPLIPNWLVPVLVAIDPFRKAAVFDPSNQAFTWMLVGIAELF